MRYSVLAVLALSTAAVRAEEPIRIIKVEPFYVVGLSARTDNASERTDQGRIGPLWRLLMQEKIGAGKEIYAVYSEYDSDQNGAYNYLLGYKVQSIEKIPEGLTAVKVLGGKYAIVTSERGPAMKVVPEVWKRIWALTPAELTRPRAFKTDFEVYGPANGDGRINVFVGLR